MRLIPRWVVPRTFSFSESKAEFVPSVIEHGRDFYSNVYGICLEKQIFPFGIYNLNWKSKDIPQYRKRMPNYVVVLVNKVLDAAEPTPQTDPDDLANRFYTVSTYCRIKYHANYTELTGLYRVRVKKVEALRPET